MIRSRETVVMSMLLLVTMLMMIAPSLHSASSLRFYIYGHEVCPACKRAKELLSSIFGEETLIFKDTFANQTFMLEYYRIHELLGLKSFEIPLIVVYRDSSALGALIGIAPPISSDERKAWLDFVNKIPGGDKIVVCEKGDCRTVEDAETIAKLNTIVLGRKVIASNDSSAGKKRKAELGRVIPLVLTAAAADSINPCTFSVYTAMLLLAMLMSRKRMLATALSFVAAIYISYTLLGVALGLGVSRFLEQEPLLRSYIKYVISGLALSFGFLSIGSSWGGEFKSPIPTRFKRIIESCVERVGNPYTAFLAGLIISYTLLPCSMGPYLPATLTLSTLSFKEFILGLLLYNTVFVLPLIIILLLMFLVGTRTIKKWRTKKLATMELISGVLLIIIAIFALVFL